MAATFKVTEMQQCMQQLVDVQVLNRNLNVPCFSCQAVCLCMPIGFDACTILASVEQTPVGSLVSNQLVSIMSIR